MLEINDDTFMYPEQKRREDFVKAPFVDEFLNYAKNFPASVGKLTSEKLLLALIQISELKEIRTHIFAEGLFYWRESEKVDFEGLKRDLMEYTVNYLAMDKDEEYATEILRKSYDKADRENFMCYTFSHILFAVLDNPTKKISELIEKNKL